MKQLLLFLAFIPFIGLAQTSPCEADLEETSINNVEGNSVTYECLARWQPRVVIEKDTLLARKVIKHLINMNMQDSLLFMQSTQVVHEASPSFATALRLYQWHIEDLASPIIVDEYRSECNDLAESRQDTARLYEMMGDEARMANDYQLARIHYLNAIPSMGAEGKRLYSKIAALYLASIGRCMEDDENGKNDDNRDLWAIYLAAYEMYVKAEDKEGMKRSQKGFPTKSDYFLYLHHKDKLQAPCWIGDEVIIRTRSDN